MFANPTTGTPLDRRTLAKHFCKVRAKAGIAGLRFHDLRHTAASHLLAQGVPVKQISEMLGLVFAARDLQKKREEKEKAEAAKQQETAGGVAATVAATGLEAMPVSPVVN